MRPEETLAKHALRASYEVRLRDIGASLDQCGLCSLHVFELDDALIARAVRGDTREPVLLERTGSEPLPSPDWESGCDSFRRVGGPETAVSCGYETFLSALGRSLDRQQADGLVIAEGTHFVAVGWRRGGSEAHEELLLAEDIAALIARSDISTTGAGRARIPGINCVTSHLSGVDGRLRRMTRR